MRMLLILLVLSFSLSAQGSFFEDLALKLKPTVMKVFGPEKTNGWYLFIEKDKRIELPAIPHQEKDSKSTKTFEKKEKSSVHYSKEEAKKYDLFFVKELFQVTRKVEADPNDLANWMNVLEQGGTREGVYRAMVLNKEYLGLENYEFSMNPATVTFSLRFLKRYLARSMRKETLEKANFYTVKRELVEKTLEVLDILFDLPADEVYDWYGIFSADMAKDYGQFFKNETRKMLMPLEHKNWAQSVPDQYLKSEVIIKIHKVLNGIQG